MEITISISAWIFIALYCTCCLFSGMLDISGAACVSCVREDPYWLPEESL